MAYPLMVNLVQSKYSNSENGLATKYLMMNNKYCRDLILAVEIMKIHRYNASGMIRTE